MIHVLRYTEELEKVGFSTEQAKKSVQIWMDLMDQNFATKTDFKEHYFMTKNDLKDLQNEVSHVASEIRSEMKELKIELKNDIKDLQNEVNHVANEIRNEMKDLKTELKDDMKDLKTEFKTDIKDLEHRLTVRLGLMLAGSIGIISALITFKH